MCLYAYSYFLDSKTGETAVKRRKGAKNSATAAKVALMKLKMHAEGDKSLPQVGLRDFEKQKCLDIVEASLYSSPRPSNYYLKSDVYHS